MTMMHGCKEGGEKRMDIFHFPSLNMLGCPASVHCFKVMTGMNEIQRRHCYTAHSRTKCISGARTAHCANDVMKQDFHI